MPGQRGTEKRALPGQVLVRLTVEAQDAVEAHAAAGGLSASAWARGVIIRAAGLPVEHARPTKRPKRQPVPAEDLAAMSRLSAWLNRHNGQLVQLTKAVREDGAAALHAQAEAALADIEGVAAELRALAARVKALDAGTGEDAE